MRFYKQKAKWNSWSWKRTWLTRRLATYSFRREHRCSRSTDLRRYQIWSKSIHLKGNLSVRRAWVVFLFTDHPRQNTMETLKRVSLLRWLQKILNYLKTTLLWIRWDSQYTSKTILKALQSPIRFHFTVRISKNGPISMQPPSRNVTSLSNCSYQPENLVH